MLVWALLVSLFQVYVHCVLCFSVGLLVVSFSVLVDCSLVCCHRSCCILGGSELPGYLNPDVGDIDYGRTRTYQPHTSLIQRARQWTIEHIKSSIRNIAATRNV